MDFDFTGAGVALITPFRENQEIDYDALEKVIENQIAGNMDFLVALGTTAETPVLSEEEKRQILTFITLKTARRIPVIAGFGGNDTAAMLRRMDTFPFDGISGLLVVTPYYNKPNQEGMFRHFDALARVAPVPLILYNVPSRTGVNLEAETVIRLAESSEKIVGIKDASGSIAQVTKIIKDAPAGFRVLSGDDVMALPLIAVGGHGVISVIANALPGKLSQLIHFALSGDFSKAAEIHRSMNELFRLQFLDGNPAGVKAMMEYYGIIRNVLRLPLIPASYKTKELIINELSMLA